MWSKVFIGGFSLDISLRIVHIQLYVFKIIFFRQLSDMCIDKWSTIIRDDSSGNAEVTNDTIVDEVGYNSPDNSPEVSVSTHFV